MADREVRIKLSAVSGTSPGGDPLQKMAKDAKNVDSTLKATGKTWQEIGREIAKSSGSLDKFSDRLKAINQDKAFEKMATSILKGSKNLDDFTAKMQRLEAQQRRINAGSKAFAEFGKTGGVSWNKAGQTVEGGAGLLGAGGRVGPAGLAVAAGGIMGRDAMQLFGLGQAGARLGDLQKGEGGTILGSYYGLKDTLSGREFRDRRENMQLEQIQGREARKFAASMSRDRLADSESEFGRIGETARVLDPIQLLRAQRYQIEDTIGADDRSGLRLRAGERRAAADDAIGAFQAAKPGSNAQLEALQKAQNLTKQALQDEAKLVDLMKQRATLAAQVVTAKQQEVQGLKQQFANLDPAQREEAIRLAAKLKEGKQLSGEEERLASSFGVLDKQLQKSQMAQIDKDPAFARLLAQSGDQAFEAAAAKALEAGSFEIRIELDEDALLTKLKEEIGPFFEKVEKMERNLIGLEGQQQRAQQRRQVRQGALVE